MPRAKARRQIPVLALDIVDDAAARPGEQRGDYETNALAGTGRRKAENMLGAIVPQIPVLVRADHHAVLLQEASLLDFLVGCPPRRPIGL